MSSPSKKKVPKKEQPASRRFVLAPHSIEAPPLTPGLYPVATPIGHLKDISLRALEILAAADGVACEDRRVTSVLFKRYGLTTPLLSYHEHNAAVQRPRLLALIRAGQAIALVSDAGTPLICDPGYRLVKEAQEEGLPVIPIPGPSALMVALMGAGLPTDQFLFGGFLPPRSALRRRRLEPLKSFSGTLAFFETPQRLVESLEDMCHSFGPDRLACVARELTKCHETFHRASLATLLAFFQKTPPRGESVVIIAPADEVGEELCSGKQSSEDLNALLTVLLPTQGPAQAARLLARVSGVSRNALYQRALTLQKDKRESHETEAP